MSHYPRVALVGRTNAGKSTLWNRLTETTRTLTSAAPHTTRDRKYGLVFWRGMTFELIDTGGLDTETSEIGLNISAQTDLALSEADVLLFVVDARAGVSAEDRRWIRHAQRFHKPIIVVANKIDTIKFLPFAHEQAIYRLTGGEPAVVSGSTGLGAGDLLDRVLTLLEDKQRPAPEFKETASSLHLLFLGRPNVGKSSLVNAIIGEERMIVSPQAHTTREPQDTHLAYKDHEIVLVDTAGMRRHKSTKEGLESVSVMLNLKALERTDVACLVIDVTEDPTTYDRHLAGELEKHQAGLIIVANKWDLVQDKSTGSTVEWERMIRSSFPFLNWAPIVFVSAKEKQRMNQLLDLALKVEQERQRKIDYNAVNRILKACIKSKKPLPSYGPSSPRIYDVAQVGSAPPSFLITVVGEKDTIHPSWTKFFEKRLREKFGFEGTPIKVNVRQVPRAKSDRARNQLGPGMVAAVGAIKEPVRLVNQTRRRQKWQ